MALRNNASSSTGGNGSARGGAKLKLSDRLRNMRFMRAREEQDQQNEQQTQQREREKASQWTIDTQTIEQNENQVQKQHVNINNKPLIIVEDGYIDIPDDNDNDNDSDNGHFIGRQSFGKFNPVIEKRNQHQGTKQNDSTVNKKEEAELTYNNLNDSQQKHHHHQQQQQQPILERLNSNTTTSQQSRSGKRSFKNGPYHPSRKRRRNHYSASNFSKSR